LSCHGKSRDALTRQSFRFAVHYDELSDSFSMSQVLIQQYLNQLQDLRKVSGTHREMVVREAFKDLPINSEGSGVTHDISHGMRNITPDSNSPPKQQK
jgi:hypothetical protein